MFHCDWSVAGQLMRQMSLTRTHHATVVGPICFSNRSNNCRVCKINGRQLSLVRTHHATIVFSSSLRPTDDKNRMVCARLNKDWNGRRVGVIGGRKLSRKHTMASQDVEGGVMVSCVIRQRNAPTHARMHKYSFELIYYCARRLFSAQV